MDDSLITNNLLVSLMSGITRGYTDPEDPHAPGPWPQDSLWERFVGPRPEPWREIMLNPQPLPPRSAFAVRTAQSAIQSIFAVRELVSFLPFREQTETHRSLSARLARFIEDSDSRWPRWWKYPPPPPPSWWEELVGSAPEPPDLAIMGAQFSTAAKSIAHIDPELSEEFVDAANKLLEMALSRY